MYNFADLMVGDFNLISQSMITNRALDESHFSKKMLIMNAIVER